jgi:RimJ/RimL family protein N-acetyltransferase
MLTMRLAVTEDIPSVVDLLKACVAALRTAGIDQWDEVYPTEETIQSDVACRSLYIAIDQAGAVAGVVVLNDVQDPEYSSVPWTIEATRIGVVHRLMIEPRFQGRGLAREVMRLVEERASALGYNVLRLDAFTHNPRALRLYEALGYRDAGPMRLRKGIFRGFEKRLTTNWRAPEHLSA